ncbi:MAG: insulinase family protein [Rhodobiaceae bacterium]|nr:insulinase family protein [Rhodobiaceae bacterium]MCC0054839.1 insulinase family protein [Rhodobiaceae bacterium]
MAVERTDLPGGLRIVTDAMPHLETAAVQVWVRTGARNESPAEHGISHLLEHMAFKGTQRRSAAAIAEEIESVGGDLNAATSHETTAYYARVLKEDVPLAIDILSDILVGSTFDPAELAREQNVIVQEIGAAHDTPDDLVHDLLQEAAFSGQALGRSILGTPDSVRAASSDDLRGYLNARYHGPDIVVSAAGAVDHGAVVREFEARFGKLATAPAPKSEVARYVGGDNRVVRDTEQYQVALALPAPGYRDEGYFTYRVAAAILGGAMSSRLFQEIRERRGLCYSVFSYLAAYEDAGLFSIAAATEPETAQEMLTAIAGELKRAASDISDREVDRARAQAKAGILMSLESASARAEQIGRQILMYDRVWTMEELMDRFAAIDSAGVRDKIGGVLSGGSVSLATVGPKIDLESAEAFREKLC